MLVIPNKDLSDDVFFVFSLCCEKQEPVFEICTYLLEYYSGRYWDMQRGKFLRLQQTGQLAFAAGTVTALDN